MRNKVFWLLASFSFLLALPDLVWAQTLPLVTTKGVGANTTYSVPVETLLALTALSFLPAALILLTSFTRILIVFSLLRQALGLTTMPPNIVLIGLSFFLTLFIMNPVFENIYQKAYQPYTAGKMNFSQAVDVGSVPLKEFMLKQTRRDDLNLFAKMYGKPIDDRENVPMTVLIPAFAISEIKTGFLIGFVIYLPFLAIDFAVDKACQFAQTFSNRGAIRFNAGGICC